MLQHKRHESRFYSSAKAASNLTSTRNYPTMKFSTIAFSFASVVQAVSIWNPSGPYYVGYTQHIFDHITPNDPTKPGTFMLITIYYPTLQIANKTIPYLDPISAANFESTIGLTTGVLSQLTTRLQLDAPTLPGTHPSFANGTSPYPTLVFTPGAGVPASGYTAYLSELASNGYAIIAIDHPGEAPYIPLPSSNSTNGTKGVYGYPNFHAYPPTIKEAFQVVDFRVSDIVAAVRDFFPTFVQQSGAPFNTTHLGLFGHSAGGAAAAAAMTANPELFKIGSNLDGTYLQLADEEGNVDPNKIPQDLKLPLLEIGNGGHNQGPVKGGEGDPRWIAFHGVQSAWLRDVQVNNTTHLDFSDIPLWIDLLDQRAVVNDTWVGPLDGVRVTGLVNALLKQLFGFISGKGLEGVDEWAAEAPELDLLFKIDPR
jgi:dienelactone hydrolase